MNNIINLNRSTNTNPMENTMNTMEITGEKFDAFNLSYGEASFDVHYETTRHINGSQYCFREGEDRAIGIVGSTYPIRTRGHKDVIDQVRGAAHDALPDWFNDLTISQKLGRHGAWLKEEITFPAQVKDVPSKPFGGTKIIPMLSLTTSLDGLSSNVFSWGCKDLVCDNGMYIDDLKKMRKKNTANFTPEQLVAEFAGAKEAFEKQVYYVRHLASRSVSEPQIDDMIEDLFGEKKFGKKMREAINDEVSSRGPNVFSVVSAFTAYSSHESDRFAFRQTKHANNNIAVRQNDRSLDVARWMEHPLFRIAA